MITIDRKSLFGKPKILLGQLNSSGDCLYATAIARQIKKDFPGCILTWAIGSMYRSILDGNPYVDEIWEIPLSDIKKASEVWTKFEQEAISRKKIGDFDKIFLTQLAPGNLQNYDGSIRSSILRAYPNPITVSIKPVIRLNDCEVQKVQNFVKMNDLSFKKNVILFECAPQSQQSLITPAFAKEVAKKIISMVPNTAVILSSNISIESSEKCIIDGSILTYRENAELTKYCTLLVGCSSGISWLCTSDWSKPLPMIQIISPESFWFASFVHDYRIWGLSLESIIEMRDCGVDRIVDCISTTITSGFKNAKKKYHEDIPMKFDTVQKILNGFLLQLEFVKAYQLIRINFQRHKLNLGLVITCFKSLLFIVIKIIRKFFSVKYSNRLKKA